MNNEYKEIFIENDTLNDIKQDYKPFKKYIDESKNKYVTSFYNLSGDTILIIPIPRKNKDYSSFDTRIGLEKETS
jgi:hypothetical protein